MDQELPQSYGAESPSPISFPEEGELCNRIDALYQSSGIQTKIPASSFFRGALHAIRDKTNPDWMAQVAHSLREILYQFQYRSASNHWQQVLQSYGSTYNPSTMIADINDYYEFINRVAHHAFESAEKDKLIGGSSSRPVTLTDDLFESVVMRFGKIMHAVLRRQLETHAEIDSVLRQGPPKL